MCKQARFRRRKLLLLHPGTGAGLGTNLICSVLYSVYMGLLVCGRGGVYRYAIDLALILSFTLFLFCFSRFSSEANPPLFFFPFSFFFCHLFWLIHIYAVILLAERMIARSAVVAVTLFEFCRRR